MMRLAFRRRRPT